MDPRNIDLSKIDLGDQQVLVLRPNQKPVVSSYPEAAVSIVTAMERAAFRDGVKRTLGYIDASRIAFAIASGKSGQKALKEFQLSAVVLENSLRELCELAGIPYADIPAQVEKNGGHI